MATVMRGASRESLDAARDRLDALMSPGTGAGVSPADLGEQLFAVVDLLDAQPALRGALTDPSREGSAKADLVGSLLRGKVSDEALDLVSGMARSRWSAPRDLADALSDLGVWSVATSADRGGRLDAVEDDVFRFGQVVRATPELRQALTDRAAPAEVKGALVDQLVAGKAAPEPTVLLRRAVATPRGVSLEDALGDLEREVAQRRSRTTATVVAAVPLTATQRERLAAALSQQLGLTVQLNVIVDPAVVGGLKVTVGDEVLDATLTRRIDDARRSITG